MVAEILTTLGDFAFLSARMFSDKLTQPTMASSAATLSPHNKLFVVNSRFTISPLLKYGILQGFSDSLSKRRSWI